MKTVVLAYHSIGCEGVKALLECGYEIACINETGVNRLGSTNKLELFRIPVDAFQNDASFRSLIGQPKWFSY